MRLGMGLHVDFASGQQSTGARPGSSAGLSMRAVNIVSGACGGLTMISIFHPLDTIKTRYAGTLF
jgi:hypothetical protein